jgi:hypothetical protein
MRPLPALDGSVDVYPTEQAMVLAHGLQYRPRPVFQSYMAYTPALEAANAAALRGPAAPDWVLFHLRPIDGRLPALDDAASWPELLARYRWAGVAGDMAVLQRRADPRPWHVEAAVPFHAVAGEWIALPAPAGDLIWLRASLAQGDAVSAGSNWPENAELICPPNPSTGTSLRTTKDAERSHAQAGGLDGD